MSAVVGDGERPGWTGDQRGALTCSNSVLVDGQGGPDPAHPLTGTVMTYVDCNDRVSYCALRHKLQDAGLGTGSPLVAVAPLDCVRVGGSS
jgi:hypothetical protein